MIDVSQEKLVPFSKAAKLLPAPVHVSTLHRWRLHGSHGIRLETLLVGGKRYTSAAALQRFFERVTAASEGLHEPPRTAKQRNREIAGAESALKASGV